MQVKESCQYIRDHAVRIPTDSRDKVLAVTEHAEETEKWNRILVDGWAIEWKSTSLRSCFSKLET